MVVLNLKSIPHVLNLRKKTDVKIMSEETDPQGNSIVIQTIVLAPGVWYIKSSGDCGGLQKFESLKVV